MTERPQEQAMERGASAWSMLARHLLIVVGIALIVVEPHMWQSWTAGSALILLAFFEGGR